MEYWQREHLRKNMPKLVEFTTCNALLLTQLQAFDLLHFSDVEILRDTKGTTEQALKLYEILQKKIGAFDLLKDALRETLQTGALDIMNQYKPKLMKYGAIEYDTTLLLGEGSMSTKVYKGRFNEREAAVKVLPQSLIPEEKAMREIDLLIKLDAHKNIIRYFGKEVTNEFVLIALELCTTNLFDFVTKSRKSYPEWNIMQLLQEATEGVAYLHENGIIHRDLKPGNILLQALGKEFNGVFVKVSDFGIAQKIPDGSSYLKLSTTGHGTEDWSAPEVLKYLDEEDEEDDEDRDELKMTHQMDVFSLGCIFFFAVSGGLHPFGKKRAKRRSNVRKGKAVNLMKDNVLEVIPKVELFVQLIQEMVALEVVKRPMTKEILRSFDKAYKTDEPDVYDTKAPKLDAGISTLKIAELSKMEASHLTSPSPAQLTKEALNDKTTSLLKYVLPSPPPFYVNRTLKENASGFKQFYKNKSFTEDQFLNAINENSSLRGIVIRDKVYAGNTTLLSQLGGKLTAKYGKKVVYMTFRDFIKQVELDETYSSKKTEEIISFMLDIATNTSKTPINDFFLDGFKLSQNKDVCKRQETMITDALKFISSRIPPIRVWITTNYKGLKVINNIIDVQCYSIEPLVDTSQIELIVSYWKNINESLNDNLKLNAFASECLALHSKETFNKGNPLECLVIAIVNLESISNFTAGKKADPIVSPNKINPWTKPLFKNAGGQQMELNKLKLILDLNLDYEYEDYNGNSLIFLCSYNLIKLKLLIEKGANLDHLNRNNQNLLQYAVSKNMNSVVLEYIVSLNKFDINCVADYEDDEGNSSLFLCVNSMKIFELLMEEGANLYHCNKSNENILQFAVGRENVDLKVLEYILSIKKFNINGVDSNGWTPLFHSIKCIKNCKFLVERGANVEYLDNDNRNVLHYTARHGSYDVLEYLLKLRIVNVNAVDKHGRTPLDYARKRNSHIINGQTIKYEIQRLLIYYGAVYSVK